MVRLPPAPSGGVVDDEAVVEWLAKEHGVCVIPGTACGTPGQVRVCFANLPPAQCAEAAARLEAGLSALTTASPLYAG
jgi:aspartate/methionine/tyrosine aminotransferase